MDFKANGSTGHFQNAALYEDIKKAVKRAQKTVSALWWWAGGTQQSNIMSGVNGKMAGLYYLCNVFLVIINF